MLAHNKDTPMLLFHLLRHLAVCSAAARQAGAARALRLAGPAGPPFFAWRAQALRHTILFTTPT